MKSSINSASSSDSNHTSTTTTSSRYTEQFPNLKPTPDYKPYSEQELYIRQLNHTRINGRIGSRLTQVYKPQRDINNPIKI